MSPTLPLSTRPPSSPPRARRALGLAACLALLAGCSSDDDDASDTTAPPDTTETPGETGDARTLAFVSGATPVTFDAGQIERFEIGDTVVSTGVTRATGSDIQVATDGTDVYEIGRFNLDSLTRYAPGDLESPIWQYTVRGEETAPNPYDVVFASETKAYVVRYGSPLVWIVDPTATTEANFRTGTIDLSAYDEDGVPNASDAVLVDGKLFVLMQRLDESFAPSRDGYVAVIDTATDTEIDTGMGEDGLFGIPLESSNPQGLSYLAASDELYVVGRGNIFGDPSIESDPYDGGLEVIDPTTYVRDTLVDDGTAEDNDGFLADALVLSPEKGYLLHYTAFGVTTLRAFDPLTGLVDEDAVAGLEDRDITVLAEAPDGRVWIGLNDPDIEDADTSPGFTVLDPSDDSIAIEHVATEFNPNGIVFVEVPTASGTD